MRVWLDNLRPGSLLILDEAHHAAPASGTKYAIDSKFTRAIRDLAPRFEHRLFLSATPHNGHSNSFSALLELLDDKRFMRGVPVLKSALDAVMVRRLKEDVRVIAGGFPVRKVVQVDLKDLPADSPELLLADWLDAYATVRRERLSAATKREQTQGALILSTLQQRLFSSIEGFQRTLAAHRKAMEKVWAGETSTRRGASAADVAQLTAGYDNDDDRSLLPAEQQEADAAAALESATTAAVGTATESMVARERQLLGDMARLAEQHRHRPDARIAWLVNWMQVNCCADVRLPGTPRPPTGAPWSPLRLIIFTEYEDTARYLRTQLEAAINGTDQSASRIEVFHGPTPPDKREQLKRASNEPPDRQPLRILIATDDAREGLNLQAHCWHLFHFDLPWNPARLEQRDGRVDRKLQPNADVFCHYFVYAQRPEDRVLRALVRKTETIRLELGSLSEVIETRLRLGIRRADVAATAAEIEGWEDDPERRAAREAELDEAAKDRQARLRTEIDSLRNRINDARRWIGLDEVQFRDALNCSLECLEAEPLREAFTPPGEPARYAFPNLQARRGADPRWAATLDTLRTPLSRDQTLFEWRREAPLRPVVFTPPSGFGGDTVQLHLSHRVVQRLLSRFLSQGFVHHDLSRACLAQSDDAIPRVVLLGRLALYGAGAARLHEALITVTARWTDPADRKQPMTPYGREAEGRTMTLLQESLKPGGSKGSVPETAQQRLKAAMAQDTQQLLPHLEQRGQAARGDAESQLAERGRLESESLRKILEDQRRRVLAKYESTEADQLLLGFNDDEKRQISADRRHWERWLANVDGDLSREPRRIAEFYQTQSFRIEPVGLAYLWPVTG